MKITKRQLKQIIKEELQKVLNEEEISDEELIKLFKNKAPRQVVAAYGNNIDFIRNSWYPAYEARAEDDPSVQSRSDPHGF